MIPEQKHQSCDQCKVRYNSIFSDLDPSLLEHMSDCKKFAFYKKGEEIFQQHHHPTGIYCVNSGVIKVVQLGSKGKEQLLKLSKAGDILGYKDLLYGESYKTTAIAVEDANVCYVPQSVFSQVVKNSVNFPEKLIHMLSSDLNALEERLTSWSQKSAKEKLAECLLLLKEAYGVDPKNGTINVMLSREDFANMIGTSTETLIRTLSDLKKDGFVKLVGKRIALQDPGAVIQLANL